MASMDNSDVWSLRKVGPFMQAMFETSPLICETKPKCYSKLNSFAFFGIDGCRLSKRKLVGKIPISATKTIAAPYFVKREASS